MSSINVTFNADTQQFVANTDNMTKSVARSAEAVAKAKNDIIASHKMQIKAAQELGASHQELESITRRTSQMMASVSETNADKVINDLNRVSKRQKEVAAEAATLKFIAPIGSADHDPITGKQAASAAIRAGENGSPGIRSIETFLTTIPGVGKALQAIFPLLGAAGLAGLFVNMGEEAYESFQKAKKGAEETKLAFESFNAPLILSVDELRKTNDELEITIARLEHKPANVLALALDEARIYADKLSASAQKAAADVKKLLSENKVGLLQFAMTGQAGTETVSKELNQRMTDMSNMQRDNRDALRSGRDTPEAAKARAEAIQQRTKDNYDWAHSNRVGIQAMDKTGMGKSIVNILGGAEDYFGGDLDLTHEQNRNVVDQSKVKTLQENKQQSTEAAAAAKKAAEAQLKGIEDTLNKRKAIEQVDVVDELNYYESKLAIAAKYPDNVEKINAKIGSLHQQFLRENESDAARAVAAQKKQVADTQRAYADLLKVATDWERQDEAKDKSAARLEEAQSRAKIAMQEWNVTQGVATGLLSKHDAAVQMATLHALDYAKQLARIDAEEKADQSRTTLTQEERDTRQNDRNVKRTELISKRDIQSASDGVSIVAATWQGALKNANSAWVQDSQDSAKQVVAIYQQALSGLNENLANLMVGDKSNFAGLFKNISKSLAGTALQRVEAPILGMFGKADGSASAPFSVKVVDGGDFGKGLSSGLAGIFGGDGNDDDNSKSGFGGFIGKVGGFLGSIFGGHKALGGGVKAGVTYDVGEMGREEFTPTSDGVITPHNQTGGGAVYYNVQVANGVTPEAMNMHMRAALQEFHPFVVRDSVKAVQGNRDRMPSSRH